MVPNKGNITLPGVDAPFRAFGAPSSAQAPYTPLGMAQSGGSGTLDLQKVVTYYADPTRGRYANKTLQEVRAELESPHYWPPPMLENVVAAMFEEYCAYLTGITYHYNAGASPFQLLFAHNQSNCIGRATGFLQLLTIAGLPASRLFRYTLPSTKGIKICEKPVARRSAAVTDYGPRVESLPRPAPNVVQVRYRGGVLQVERTSREPFVNHDATFIDISSFSRQCWDPLLMMSYGEASDCFDSYKDVSHDAELFANDQWAKLRKRGLECYVSEEPGRGGDRIYYLPPRAMLEKTLTFPHFRRDVQNQTALIQTYTDLAIIDSAQRLAVLFDQEDWNHLQDTHPPALLDMFSFSAL
jgi:hypothetical protein